APWTSPTKQWNNFFAPKPSLIRSSIVTSTALSSFSNTANSVISPCTWAISLASALRILYSIFVTNKTQSYKFKKSINYEKVVVSQNNRYLCFGKQLLI